MNEIADEFKIVVVKAIRQVRFFSCVFLSFSRCLYQIDIFPPHLERTNGRTNARTHRFVCF